ncbi:MAG: CBS domain-containing protein [Deinococcus sp.]|nr:CBS domain-containing protein [Deinococcus sp.]
MFRSSVEWEPVAGFTSPVPAVQADASWPEACQLMRRAGVRKLPVVDKGKLVGVITWGDLREAGPSDATSLARWEYPALLAHLPVRQIMSCPPVTISPSTPLRQAAALMLQHGIEGLVVLEGGRILGMLTAANILQALSEGRDRLC